MCSEWKIRALIKVFLCFISLRNSSRIIHRNLLLLIRILAHLQIVEVERRLRLSIITYFQKSHFTRILNFVRTVKIIRYTQLLSGRNRSTSFDLTVYIQQQKTVAR